MIECLRVSALILLRMSMARPRRTTNQGNRRAATAVCQVEDTYRRAWVDRRVRRQAGVRWAQRAAERAEHGVGQWRFGSHNASCVRLRENAGVCNTAHDRGRALSHDSLGERLRKNGNARIAASTESQATSQSAAMQGQPIFNEGTLGARKRTRPHNVTLQLATPERRAGGAA